ncbi:MAG: 50S ribosomal protein L28 [Chloroflexi bacterium]|nr:50S ribosomal protein L28 [Chloroflexota bacterium]
MAGRCQVCGKIATTGNKVSHSKRHTRRVWAPNIQKHAVVLEGMRRRVNVCTRCLRTLHKTKA